MNKFAWVLIAAAFLPLLAAVAAKAGGKAYDNNDPRRWLAQQEGWRARANAAQVNLFEGLPFFYAAVLFALFNQADQNWLFTLTLAWIGLRMIYIGIYVAGYGALRTLVWALAIAVNVAIVLAGV